MCKTKTTGSKKHFFLSNHQFFCWFPKDPLKISWRSGILRPLGDLQGTSPGRRVPAGKAFTLIITLLLTHGDIEINPGPQRRTSNYFSYSNWDLNTIMAHSKLSLLSAYNTRHKFDIICISETYLDKSADHDALSTDGYNTIRDDHPHNQKRGGACIYFKEQLKLK